MSNQNHFNAYPATKDEIPTLIAHHRKMFEEIWAVREMKLDSRKMLEMDEAYKKKLSEELKTNACKAWVIKVEDEIVAGGAISIVSMVPLPDDSSYKVAYVHSVYTEPEYRAKGLAALIIKQIINYCRQNQINRITLHASDAGKSIYEKLGFIVSESSMNLMLGDVD